MIEADRGEQYCDDDSNCNFVPAADHNCYIEGGRPVTWEPSGSCTFTTGVTFSRTVEKSLVEYVVVGLVTSDELGRSLLRELMIK